MGAEGAHPFPPEALWPFGFKGVSVSGTLGKAPGSPTKGLGANSAVSNAINAEWGRILVQ